ncbi:NAD(P)/FAD-dependent oxidoreductase [Streptomyces sp. NBC_00209]|uniref:NAD(P)/FAD-dependent oxidoreductase n=1 Tax=Streptomyces sp. NBC_00209 TaxID=2975682 RepID=UPI00324B7374
MPDKDHATAGSVLIVGASAAGLATAEALRRNEYQGALTLLDAEQHPPYDRPPLSKQVLKGDWEPSRAHLRTDEQLAALDAEFVAGDAAASFDSAARTVTTRTGRQLRADHVVIATGMHPRTLPGQDALAGVHVLRSMGDALRLRRDLLGAERLVVVGAGVLGTEVAASARTLGLDVTIVAPATTLLGDQVGDVVGGLLTQLHTEQGVRMRLGVAVDHLTGEDGQVTGVQLSSGEVLPASVVVIAVGAHPATGWLTGSGLTLGDGIECDAHCRAAPGTWAVGDVASWYDVRLGRRLRLENRTNATEQAQTVAANILGATRPYTPVPYFWTDQYAAKIQVHGLPSPLDDVTVVEGDVEERRFAALYSQGGRATAVLGWNMPKQARLLRQQHLTGPPGADAARSA